MTMRRMRGIYSWTPSPLLTVMCSVGDLLPRSGGGMACQAAGKPWQAYACLKCRRAAPAALPFLPVMRLPAAWRHPVVRPDSDRQLLAHPPVSAEPAGAVSGCRYGPMSEKPGLQRPFRSRRPCRAGNGAPCTPDGV
ncbi:hypothetical protein [Escherichia coli]|uniref:hypothetical protein n=1 Tax=Escherichia coli TaxID=562 RepID=UPI0015F0885F|nr:hypothetical protein [Escherichia coli]